jgi:hypothetical protein
MMEKPSPIISPIFMPPFLIQSPVAVQPLLGSGLFFRFVIFSKQTVGLLRRVISLLQGRYLHTGEHKHKINAHADIHTISGIRTNDPSFRAKEGSIYSTLRSSNTNN